MESDEVYAAVGKVIVDAAFMEWTAALLLATLNGEDRSYAEDLCRKGKVMRSLEKAAESDAELSQIYTEISEIRKKRNELAHSVGMVSSDARGRDIYLYFRLLHGDETTDDLRQYPSEILGLAREIGVAISCLVRINQERSEVSAM